MRHRRIRLLCAVLVATGLGVVPSAAAAAAGDLDPGFSGDGVHVDPADGVIGPSVEVQEDGKIVVAGFGPAGGVVQRFLPSGAPDLSFGGDGEVVADFGAPTEIWGMAVQADGRIVIAGTSAVPADADDSDLAIARYTASGALDTTFRGDGIARLDLGFRDGAHAVAATPDGKILVAGRSQVGGGFDFLVARFTATGALDGAFSGDGRVTVGFGGVADEAMDVEVQADGKVVVAGRTDAGGTADHDFAVARLRSGGALDHGFHLDGKVTTDFGGSDKAAGLALRPDGRLVVAGWRVGGGSDFALARYTAAGELDTSFHGDGRLTTAFGATYDYAKDVAIQPDGRIVVVGSARVSPVGDGDFALARYRPSGALDSSFGDGGRVETDVSGYDSLGSLALQDDGRIVVSGATGDDGSRHLVVARYQ
ncbi:hypothetical protein [Nocardioides antri]|uniref:Delta-60 repeat domain-containing protein n=1 Tax=Nocardioides antri TaxID=2607659 RepID=A0A5B1LV99_9ACTN|nr:hypothetical protein [Nocardioides antri]KAA1424334.1 hypothetical protein F0U47_19060 [Nocardioides antri]